MSLCLPKNRPNLIYVLKMVFETKTLYKIGRSFDPNQRARTIYLNNPTVVSCEIVRTCKNHMFTSANGKKDLELALLGELRYRLGQRGDYFDTTLGVIDSSIRQVLTALRNKNHYIVSQRYRLR